MNARLPLLVCALRAVISAQTPVALPPEGDVSLPVDEYNRLVELAARPAKSVQPLPFDYALKSARLNLHADSAKVSGTIDLQGEVLTAGERKVPLVSGMIVLDAQQKGKPLSIEHEGALHSALLSGPAEFAISLETGMELTMEPGRASFQLPAPAAGAVRLSLAVPGQETLVNLSPGLITSRSSHDGQTWIEATLVPGQVSSIWWASRLVAAPPAPPKETRFLSDVKTLISVSDAEVRVATLAEITVMQGEPSQFEVVVPEGYELTGATGATLLGSDTQSKSVVLRVTTRAARRHQFLISLAKVNNDPKAEVALPSFAQSQRETGEVLVEGEGTMELQASERGGLRRMDFKEASQYLLSMARNPVRAAFRYQKRPSEAPIVAMEWLRFPDSPVLSAVAQQAEATTLVTSSGRTLTEVKLTLKNQSQPFLKLALPVGASILSSEVAGEKVKPVEGPDGARVPLLRPGFRPSDSYTISFVFLHAGAPFEKKGGAELALPKMDIPVGLLRWEVFLPERYRVEDFGGDAISERLLPSSLDEEAPTLPMNAGPVAPGQIGGVIADPVGAVIPNATVVAQHMESGMTRTATTDTGGRWSIAGLPSGQVKLTISGPGFRTIVRYLQHDASRGSRLSATLDVGSVTETVEVRAESNAVETQQVERRVRQNAAAQDTNASMNVKDLQRRVAGVLPIAVTVPHTGNSYRFVRPLVVDEETTVSFRYRSK